MEKNTPEQTKDAWDKFAQGYDDAVTPFGMSIAGDVLKRFDINPDTQLLDVAAGGGALSIPAARLGAQVLATDFSSAMVQRLKERAQNEGLSNLASSIMDGHNLELEDNSFDISASQFGIMLFPDRLKALSELARVTKPGGHGLLIAFSSPPKVEAFAFFFKALQSTIPGFAPPQDSPIFSLQNPENLRSEMTAAGFTDVRVETVDYSLSVESGKHLWNILTSATPPIGAIAAKLNQDQITSAQKTLDDIFKQRFAEGPISLNMQVNIGIGTK